MSERVATIEAFVVEIPRDTPYLGALGPGETVNARGYFVRAGNRTVYTTTDRSILLRVATASGVVGWGETYGLVAPRATVEIILELFAPFVIGRDPRDPAALHDDLRDMMRVRGSAGGFYGDALAAVDIALWDIAAKLAGLSLSRLLGGRRRDRVPGYVSGLPKPSLTERVALAEEWAGRGFRNFKFAAAVSELGEVAELAALRRALGPDIGIGVDLHWRYTSGDAIALIHRMLPSHPLFAEAPVAPEDIFGLRAVASASAVPIAAGEEWFSVFEVAQRLPGPAILQPEMGHTGVTEFIRIAGLAQAHHLRVMPHATIGLGVFLAASLQVCATLPEAPLHEYQHSVFDRNLLFLDGDLRMDGTDYVVPDAPGLGVAPSAAVWAHATKI